MKIDKANPKHWFYLLLGSVYLVILLPSFWFSKKSKIIVFYGHKFNGNLKAFYKYLQETSDFVPYYLSLDQDYLESLKHENLNLLSAISFRDLYRLSRSELLITDHGLHNLIILQLLTKLKLVDVWHGVPFKGFNQDDFKHLHRHYHTWVSSPYIKKIYIKKLGFTDEQVKVTGYARTDDLINKNYDKNKLMKKYGLDNKKRVILIAPTWKQDSKNRSIIPFGLEQQEFFSKLDGFAQKKTSTIVFRAHLNAKEIEETQAYENIKFMSHHDYPDAEEFLFISDLLVSDWSSIVFDYLPLRRPTIFLDVPAPFKRNFTVPPKNRFGYIAKDMPNLLTGIEKYLNNPSKFNKEFEDQMNETSKLIYDIYADGKSSERYSHEMKALLSKD